MNVYVSELSAEIQVRSAPDHSFGAKIPPHITQVREIFIEMFQAKAFATAYIQQGGGIRLLHQILDFVKKSPQILGKSETIDKSYLIAR